MSQNEFQRVGVIWCGNVLIIYLWPQQNAFNNFPRQCINHDLHNSFGVSRSYPRQCDVSMLIPSSKSKGELNLLLLGLGLSLLLDVVLSTTLLSLAGVVLLLVLSLCSRVASDARDGTANGARDAVCDSRAQV